MLTPKRDLLTKLLIALSLLALIGTGCQSSASSYAYKGAAIDPPVALPDFELRAVNGEPFRLSDLQGKIALVYFGYTYCPDVCPLTMWEIRTAIGQLETGQDKIHPIFISVDPERDTPEILANYMAAFGPQFIGISDDMDNVQEVMKAYGAFAQKEETPDSALGYLVSHSANLFLVGPKRQLLLQYPFGFAAEDLRSDLAYLLEQQGP